MDIIYVLVPKAYEEKKPLDELLKGYKNLLATITEKNIKMFCYVV